MPSSANGYMRLVLMLPYQGFIQGVILGGEFGGCVQRVHYMCASVYPLDCNEILDIVKDKGHQIQLLYIKSVIMLHIVAVEAIMTSNFLGGGSKSQCPPPHPLSV